MYTIQYIYYTVEPATSQYAIVCKTQHYMYLRLHYISAVTSIRIVLDRWIQQYLCMVITYSKSMDHPGKVANPARSQLNRGNEYIAVRVRA